jgi:hypothetical protein
MTIHISSLEIRSHRRSSAITRVLGCPLGRVTLFLLVIIAVLASNARAQSTDPADQICPRFLPGSSVPAPPDLWSTNGTFEVTFTFQTTVDEQGLTRYCYIANGTAALEAPTLHIYPGDQLIINFQNDLPAATLSRMMHGMNMPAMKGMNMEIGQAAGSSSGASSDCPRERSRTLHARNRAVRRG